MAPFLGGHIVRTTYFFLRGGTYFLLRGVPSVGYLGGGAGRGPLSGLRPFALPSCLLASRSLLYRLLAGCL